MRQAPAYCVHKSRNLAYVRLAGRMVYLGRAHSPESRERYHTVLAAHYAGKPIERNSGPAHRANAFTVAELAELWCLAERERRGPRHQAACETVYAARDLARQHATAAGAKFGPRRCSACARPRDDMAMGQATVWSGTTQHLADDDMISTFGIPGSAVASTISFRAWGLSA